MPKSRGSSSRAACRIPLPVDRNMQVQKAEALGKMRNHEPGIPQLESRMAALSLRTVDEDGSRPPKNERLPPPPPAAAQTAADGGGGASTTTTATTTDTATTTSRLTEPPLPRARPRTDTPTAGAPASSPSAPAAGLPAAGGRVCAGQSDASGRAVDYESCSTGGETSNDGTENASYGTGATETSPAGDSDNSVDKTDVEIRQCRVVYTKIMDRERVPSEERPHGDVFAADGIASGDTSTSDRTLGCVDNRLLDATVRETRIVRNDVLSCHSPEMFVETDENVPRYDNDIIGTNVKEQYEVFSNEIEAYSVDSPISAACREHVKESADEIVASDQPFPLQSETDLGVELSHSTLNPDKLKYTDCEYFLDENLDIVPNDTVNSLNIDGDIEKSDELHCVKGNVEKIGDNGQEEEFVSDVDKCGYTEFAEEKEQGVDVQNKSVCDSAENIVNNADLKVENDISTENGFNITYTSESGVVNLRDFRNLHSVFSELGDENSARNARDGESAEHPQVPGEPCTDISEVVIGMLDNLERAECAVDTLGVKDLSEAPEAKVQYKPDFNDDAEIQLVKFSSAADEGGEVQSSLPMSDAIAETLKDARVLSCETVGLSSGYGSDSPSDDSRRDGGIPVAVCDETQYPAQVVGTVTQADFSPRRARRDCKPSIQRLLSDIQEHALVSPTDSSGLQLGLESGEADLEMPTNVVPDDRTYSLDSLSPDSNLNRPNIATPGSCSSESKQKETPPEARLPVWPAGENAAPKGEGGELDEATFGSVRPRLPTGDHTISDVDSVQTPSPMEAGGLGRTGIIDSAVIMRQSYGAGDTWNEEVSPNDVSFPSLTVPEGSESTELDAVRPPSLMTSLVSMTTSSETGAALAAEAEAVAAAINITTQQSGGSARHSRKRSLPSLMVRRALGSLENLSGDGGCVSASSSCTSQLDHVRPPADMESSMLSVASITSEVAEVEEDLPDGGGSCSTGGEDLTESGSGGGGGTASPVTHGTSAKPTAASRIATGGIPRQTPRQRRQAARDRYRTYTVNTAAAAAAELHATVAGETVEEAVEVTTPLAEEPPPSEISPPPENESGIRTGTYRITPKQRRQEDRQRFQTQVLDKPAVAVAAASPPSPTAQSCDVPESPPAAESTPAVAVAAIRKHRRAVEGRDRFRTRTLDGDRDPRAAEDAENHSPPSAADELLLNSLLEREAHILAEEVETLRATDSLLLECETLSLVSVDSENTSESGHGVEGSNGDEDADAEAEVEVEVEVEVEAEPPHVELLHPTLDDEGEEGDAEEKTLRAGGCDTPDPDDLLGLGDGEEATGIRRQRAVSECAASEETVGAEVVGKEEEHGEGLSENSEDQSSSTDDEGCAQKKPRIVKPVTRSRDGSADGSPKPIRGRRKPLRAGRSGIPVTAVAPIKIPVIATTKVPQPKLQQPKQQQQPSQIPLQLQPVVPAQPEAEQEQPDPRFRPPERQGTFTKDEPTAVAAAKPTAATALQTEPNRKKRRPVTGGRATASASAVAVGAQAASTPTSAKRGVARREATSKIAGLWKKAEESKTKQKQQQQLQKKEARGGGSTAAHAPQAAAPQKASSASGRGRVSARAPTSRIPTADSAVAPTRAEKAARKELTSAAARTERGGQSAGRGATGIAGSAAKLRRAREEPVATTTAPASHGPGRPFARPANPRPASAIVQPFNYSPPTSQVQQPPPARSQIPTLVKREEPPLQLNTASIRITTV